MQTAMNTLFKCMMLFGLVIVLFGNSACEDTINPKLEQASPVFVVDAWINNKPEPQVIKLTLSQPYLENDKLPPGVTGATIVVTDNDAQQYVFQEDTNEAGTYRWTPAAGQTFGAVGKSYTLSITANGEEFTATSYMGRVPAIDSITFESNEDSPFYDDGYTGQFWASEPAGKGDAYWIRAHKNGVLLNKPSEITIAYDAGFSQSDFDGVEFILPIRQGINPNDQDENDEPIAPYQIGDSVYVEIYSITHESYNFLNEVITQTDRPGGFGELFATPLANVSTNVNKVSGSTPVVGFFNVSSVSALGRRFNP